MSTKRNSLARLQPDEARANSYIEGYDMKAYEVSRAVIEQMAFDRPGLEIEFSPNTAYLKTGGTLWFAMLPKDAA